MKLSISCKITSGEYAKIVFSHFFSDNWIFLLFPLLVCGCLSILDIRILIVALMLLFVTVPFIMILVYFNYMLTNSMVWSISEKTISLTNENALVLEFENPKLRTVTVNKGEVRNVLHHKHYFLLQIESAKYRFLAIPKSSFKTDSEKQTLIEGVSKK